MATAPHTKSEYDAIVVGGGPGGSSCALTLARAGRSVLLLERDAFPRFHVGESLLTYTADMLERLGVLEKVQKSGFVVKRGVELTGTEGLSYRVDFQSIGEGRRNWTFQVERADFDKILLDSAAEAGAEVVQRARVLGPVQEAGQVTGVRYTDGTNEHTVSARYVIDASGRAGVLARALGLRKTDNSIRMMAVFKHFTGTNELYNAGAHGDIVLGNHPDGWVWAIPIREDKLSVGTVVPVDLMRAGRAEEIYEEFVGRIPRIKQRLQHTKVSAELSGETDYSHYADNLVGPGYYVVGDAGCFTDPIFSAGVFLALTTGTWAAEAINSSLTDPSVADDRARLYERFAMTGMDTYHRLIRAFYANNYSVYEYLWEECVSGGAPISSVLQLMNGDFWNPDNPLGRRLREAKEWGVFENYEPYFTHPVQGIREVALAR
ncbi:NAD(P)/FAD-dependent oxidoreductase [Micromonospora arborensis]|uniref:NAD(P)/FAD-dependent oxidoreductase n=1 Tax=Micromonospora arborensis TaxID=2116518 RepID=UPI00340E34FB